MLRFQAIFLLVSPVLLFSWGGFLVGFFFFLFFGFVLAFLFGVVLFFLQDTYNLEKKMSPTGFCLIG